VYDSGADILNGCDCGNKLFYFIKNKSKKEVNDRKYFYEYEDNENNELIVLDTETINIISNGKYEIDIQSLMNKKTLVYKYGDGKYSIDIDSFSKRKKKK
jgi:predicted  nucleic acid-binding Zn-ribbon protein